MKEQITQIQVLLREGLHQFDMEALSPSLSDYLFLLNKWNLAYNLTAIRDLESMVSKHIFDSLAILPWLKGNHIIDVGTGAGLPGIPLALARPDLNFVLLDSNGKKTRFLAEVKRQLNIKNVEIVQFRVENYHPTQGFDTVLSRAFSSLEQMIQWTQHLIVDNGIWLAMKGRYPDTELHEINQSCTIERYTVAGVEGERCCVIIENQPGK
ncbi:16S rRNA (guanine(527)-N(7))-methyltransferase RsmG [Legionella anisa]|uniref:Ribosomal RNA small subunit methyltransferase G n=1 Tax=Legionella anisa TaxID=28082 RepID=A0AAX0X0R7_9GAMM|nr:16S rRNA (guanine(527)-N(7))-methyltransferase RsmG [Legionella anisa]AWN72770.1 16S rRNA (guanine(527)-N(7))-methyltransferase RsmG [Legionella anisa]KTC73025.1 glucose inhibited division protein B GidB [Legionella anisa]MBN5937436.1 16S rRNA (guanine(527)-N(7))-methyltransferase RsmG [Legionella anisa]MCW8423565.1 16S rRNA (guanine(527)-N(7))-methyltransferase RsmG [Legionella anisa]MCW8447085.1 16S rRNA (guanine(527)-N(7))-methyltransferase RsmG [Legionella anisa]